jgi:UDP-N-acetylmuramyl pentapeptide synthase
LKIFKNYDEILEKIEELDEKIDKEKMILCKASRGMKMENLIDKIMNWFV